MEGKFKVDPKRLSDPNFVKQMAKEIFEAADEDNSGFIDRGELVKFINYYSAEAGMRIPTSKEIDKIIYTFDKNHDGKISLEEFTNFIGMVLNIIATTML